jgi:hypothetical protein
MVKPMVSNELNQRTYGQIQKNGILARLVKTETPTAIMFVRRGAQKQGLKE